MDEFLEKLGRELAKSTLQNWQKHRFPSESDETLFLFLKGHLLIEDKLENLINIHFGDERFTKKLDLTFARKALLAQAICQQYFGKAWWDSFLWPAINELNRARNEVAHTLKPSNINDRVTKLSKVYDDLGKLHEKAFRQQTGQELPRVPGSIMTVETKLRSLIYNVLTQLDGLTFGLVAICKTMADTIAESRSGILKESFDAMGRIYLEEETMHLLEGLQKLPDSEPPNARNDESGGSQ